MLTVFDVVQGHGYHISIDGAQVLSTQWNNISSQTFQVGTIWIILFLSLVSFTRSCLFLKKNVYVSTFLFQPFLEYADAPTSNTIEVYVE